MNPGHPVPAEAPDAKQGLDQSCLQHLLGYQLAQANIPIRKVFLKNIGEPLQLGTVEFTVLSLVAHNCGVTQKQLSQALAVSAPNITTLLDRLEQRRGPTQAGQVLTGAAERLDGLGLGDDVELAAPLVQLQRRVGAGLEPGPELRAGAAHPLGDGADLARLPGHQHHDAVGFAELVGTQHHRRVAVEAHPVGLIR